MNSNVYILDERILKMIISGKTSKARTVAAISFLGFTLMSKIAVDFYKEIKEKDETINALEETVRELDAKINHPDIAWNRRSEV